MEFGENSVKIIIKNVKNYDQKILTKFWAIMSEICKKKIKYFVKFKLKIIKTD